MELTSIITMANNKVRLQFLAMERSLRATGCALPLQVIPYNDDLFDLPASATWALNAEIAAWLTAEKGHPMMRKYQCLTESNYQYVDSDIIFTDNPEAALDPYQGFVVCCSEWNKPAWTYTEESRLILAARSSTWQRMVFSAGQFACDRALYDVCSLRATAMHPDFVQTCIRYPTHDQPGMNLLVHDSNVPITNLTLPPTCMESTWAGDYPGEYEPLWRDPARKPYLIHWAGPTLEQPLPINQLFYDYLTRAERAEWDEQLRQTIQRRNRQYERSLPLPRRIARKVLRRNIA